MEFGTNLLVPIELPFGLSPALATKLAATASNFRDEVLTGGGNSALHGMDLSAAKNNFSSAVRPGA